MAAPRSVGITFLNARFSSGEVSTLRILGPHIAGIAEAPHPGDCVVDLQGERVLPGLINAHEHLQLNSLPRREPSSGYHHVREWISEVGARRLAEPEFAAALAVGRDARLLIGGIKNLLSGVTTIAHHDPLYPLLQNGAFPTRVLRRYGWSHSLYVDGDQRVRDSYRRTPGGWPWIIHAAEGLGNEAANEFERLDALGCIGPNTLLVHGIALDAAQRARLRRAAAGLIWCPSSNLRLFGRTAEVADLMRHGQVALGTDSRLSGARDLLEELQVARDLGGLADAALERLVTSDAARLLRLPDRGALRAGMRADILVVPANSQLGEICRAQVRLVLIEGRVRYGDLDCAQRVQPAAAWTPIRVDGRLKILDAAIAALLAKCPAAEPGLEGLDLAGRAA